MKTSAPNQTAKQCSRWITRNLWFFISLCLNLIFYCYIVTITDFRSLFTSQNESINVHNIINEPCPPQFPKQPVPCLYDAYKYLTDLGLDKYGYCDHNNCSLCFIIKNDLVTKWKTYYRNSQINRREQLSNLLNLNPHSSNIINLMVFNSGFNYLFLNWICSVINNLETSETNEIFQNTLIVATDDDTISLINSFNLGFMIHKPTWLGDYILNKIITPDASHAFGTDSFKYLVILQIMITRDLIEMGYDVLLQDVDIIWKTNVFNYFDFNENDFLNIIDIFMMNEPRFDVYGPGNSGFIFIKSNCQTNIFMERMIDYIDVVFYGAHDQALWNFMIHWKPFRQINFKLLDQYLFVNGDKVKQDEIKIDLRREFYVFHSSYTDDHFEKIVKFHKINEWYFTSKECNVYFNNSLLPNLDNRDPDLSNDYVDVYLLAHKQLVEYAK